MTPRQAYDTHRRVERATEKAGTLDMKIKWAGYETSCVLETKDGHQHSCFTMEALEAFLDGLEFQKGLQERRESTADNDEPYYGTGQPQPRPKDEWGE